MVFGWLVVLCDDDLALGGGRKPSLYSSIASISCSELTVLTTRRILMQCDYDGNVTVQVRKSWVR